MNSTGPLIAMLCVYPLLCFALPAVIITLLVSGVWRFQSPIRRGDRQSAQSAAVKAKAGASVRRDPSGFGSG